MITTLRNPFGSVFYLASKLDVGPTLRLMFLMFNCHYKKDCIHFLFASFYIKGGSYKGKIRFPWSQLNLRGYCQRQVELLLRRNSSEGCWQNTLPISNQLYLGISLFYGGPFRGFNKLYCKNCKMETVNRRIVWNAFECMLTDAIIQNGIGNHTLQDN